MVIFFSFQCDNLNLAKFGLQYSTVWVGGEENKKYLLNTFWIKPYLNLKIISTGFRGTAGDPGDEGERGSAVDGKNGLPGPPGTDGQKGLPGDTTYGPPGIPGNRGLPGPPGAQGARGNPGIPGLQGMGQFLGNTSTCSKGKIWAKVLLVQRKLLTQIQMVTVNSTPWFTFCCLLQWCLHSTMSFPPHRGYCCFLLQVFLLPGPKLIQPSFSAGSTYRTELVLCTWCRPVSYSHSVLHIRNCLLYL